MAGPLALLGGTFDPPHAGHLFLAECARVQFAARRVVLLPAGDPYRKTREDAPFHREVTPARHRLAMTALAVAGNPAFAADGREVHRRGPTYTIDTLEEFHAAGERDLLLVLGSDALADLPNWREPLRIATLARVAVAEKDGAEGTTAALARAAGLPYTPDVLDMPRLTISSTAIRARIAAGKAVRYLVADAVLDYIETHRLYRQG